MPVPQPAMLGQPIQVPAGLTGDCGSCRDDVSGGRLVTDGTEIADVVAETSFNGRFTTQTGGAAVWLECPNCGHFVQFAIPDMRL
jgi:hypothetical protein